VKGPYDTQFQEFLSIWNMLLDSPTVSIYHQRLAEIQAKYPIGAVNLVTAWINQRPHFGVIVTSPIEGCHAILKCYLQRGHSDLRGVFNGLKLFWKAQQSTIQSTIAQQQLRPRHRINISLFAAILQHIHAYALQKILQEKAKLSTRGSPPLGCTVHAQFSSP
jgi:hypothetical protein